jgi:hypothetical protein
VGISGQAFPRTIDWRLRSGYAILGLRRAVHDTRTKTAPL